MLPNAQGNRKRDKLFKGVTAAASSAASAANTAIGKKGSAGATSIGEPDVTAAAATMPEKVSLKEWNLYGRGTVAEGRKPLAPGVESDAIILVGPVVGAVTETTGRVLIEVASAMTVTMEAFMDGESVCTVAKEVGPKTPTVFQMENLAPHKRIRVVVSVEGEVREAAFTTPRANKLNWKIATVSCNCHTHLEKIQLWNKLSHIIGDVDCVLHLGDQIYGDSDFGTKQSGEPFESAWHASLTLLEPLERELWDDHQEEVREFYRNAYRTTWNMPHVAAVLASTANYMICDDHEFTDDLGDEPEHSNPSTVHFYVATLAYQVYNEYQHQLLMDLDVKDPSIKPYYAFKLSDRVGFFMTDNRVERSLHKAQGTKATWEDRGFMGPAQWQRVEEAFQNDLADCDMVLFGTPTPLVFLSNKATSLAQRKIDDARGTWGHINFKNEQEAICNFLTDWQNAKPNRALITIGGDVHMGGYTDSWHNGSDVPLHQMTASAVGNKPEGGMTPAREAAIRSAMHADERLFAFKTRHHEWIYGPNFGMVDCSLSPDASARPHITLTLVPEGSAPPKVRNLQFGDTSIDLKKKDHSHASKHAHATATMMAAIVKQ